MILLFMGSTLSAEATTADSKTIPARVNDFALGLSGALPARASQQVALAGSPHMLCAQATYRNMDEEAARLPCV